MFITLTGHGERSEMNEGDIKFLKVLDRSGFIDQPPWLWTPDDS
jgi:hypothetical protein